MTEPRQEFDRLLPRLFVVAGVLAVGVAATSTWLQVDIGGSSFDAKRGMLVGNRRRRGHIIGGHPHDVVGHVGDERERLQSLAREGGSKSAGRQV
jgi:hypothetical protein